MGVLFAVLIWAGTVSAQNIQCLGELCTVSDDAVKVEIGTKGRVLISPAYSSQPPNVPLTTVAANVGTQRGADIDEIVTVERVLVLLQGFINERMGRPALPGNSIPSATDVQNQRLAAVATSQLNELRNTITPKLVAILSRSDIPYGSRVHALEVLGKIDPPREETLFRVKADDATKMAIKGLRGALQNPSINVEAARILLTMQSVDKEILKEAKKCLETEETRSKAKTQKPPGPK